MPKKAEAAAEALAVTEAVQEELTLLRGFRDLVAERVAYRMGVIALNAEIKEKTVEQRKAVNEANKYIKENLETFIKNATLRVTIKL
jgi:ribosomal protein S12 methylthiotransferase accessory factor YcaO